MFVLGNCKFGSGKESIEVFRDWNLFPWLAGMETFDVNLIMFTGNALHLIDIENIEGLQTLNAGQSVVVRFGGVAID